MLIIERVYDTDQCKQKRKQRLIFELSHLFRHFLTRSCSILREVFTGVSQTNNVFIYDKNVDGCYKAVLQAKKQVNLFLTIYLKKNLMNIL